MVRLKELDKPFIITCPSSMINTQYIRQLFEHNKLQIIIPAKRINVKTMLMGRFLTIYVMDVMLTVVYYCWEWIDLLISCGYNTNNFKLNCLTQFIYI